MIKTVERVVDESTYSITQFTAGKSLKLLTRLTKIVGEPISIMVGDSGLETVVTGDLIAKAIAALAQRLDENEVEKTVTDYLEGVRCDGKPIQFNTHFAGRLGHLFKVMKEILGVQYGDFLGDVASLSGQSGLVRAVNQ